MTGILEQLKWESLKKRRTDNRLVLLYKGLKGKGRIPTDDLIPKTRRCRNSHAKHFSFHLNLNLNSLLVTRQMTLFHQGVRMGEKLVP